VRVHTGHEREEAKDRVARKKTEKENGSFQSVQRSARKWELETVTGELKL